MDVKNVSLLSASPSAESLHTMPPSSPAFDTQVTWHAFGIEAPGDFWRRVAARRGVTIAGNGSAASSFESRAETCFGLSIIGGQSGPRSLMIASYHNHA